MKRFLIITLSLLNITFYGQILSKTQHKAIINKTQAKQIEILKEEKINAAIKKYDALIELNPKNDTAYFKRAEAKFNLAIFPISQGYPSPNKLNLLKDAIEDYTEVIKLKSKYTAEAYYDRASAKNNTDGVINGYIEDLQKTVEINPKYSVAWYWLGLNCENEIKCIEYFSKVIELNDSLHLQGAYSFRASHKGVLKDYKGALEDYNKAIELNKYSAKYPGDYSRRAFIKDALKDYKGAIDDYTTYIEANSNNKHFQPAEYLFLRGNSKLKAGNLDGACLDWKKAEKDFTNAKNNMGIIDTIGKYCK